MHQHRLLEGKAKVTAAAQKLGLPFDVGLQIVWLGRDAQMNVPSPMLAAFEPSTP